MEILISPVVSEKATGLSEKRNQYAFKVALKANKIEIKKAVESAYGVKVTAVNTIRYDGKAKFRYTKTGIVEGRSQGYKKAIISLAAGDTIDFYANI
jgi:large subunit ribosomal protein L23